MAANPVQYAENTLGVHHVWEDAEKTLDQQLTLLDTRVKALDTLRTLRARMTDREMELATTARAKYHDLSATAFGPVLKGIIHDDEAHAEMRQQERDQQRSVDTYDAELDQCKSRMRALSARMNELGGLLAFYAASKSATTRPQVTQGE